MRFGHAGICSERMHRIALPGPVGELAASHHGAFTRRQAASLGLSKRAIAALLACGAVRSPAPGVLVDVRHPPSWRQTMSVATMTCNSVGIAGFESAACLHGTDGNWDDKVVLLLAAPRRILLDNVTVHVGPIDAQDVTIIDGIPCTTAERTICDLGAVLGDMPLRLAFEWYWRTRGNLTALQAAVDRLHRPGQRGTKAVQALIVEARLKGRPTDSALEVRLDAILGDIEGIVRQHEVRDAAGAFVARVDFALPAHRLAIEAHSRQYHESPEATARDEARHARLIAADWRVRYVTSTEMSDPCKVRSSVLRLVHSDESPTVPRFTDPPPSRRT